MEFLADCGLQVAVIGSAVAVGLAYRGKSLFQVSLAACAVVFVLELFLC